MVFPIGKFIRAAKIIMANGGIIGSCSKLWRTDTLKLGTYVGTDSFGNKYYQSEYYMIGRSRWVEFNPKFKFEYDGSQVSAEWYGWLHYKTDCIPCSNCAQLELLTCPWSHCWLLPHEENLTGTERAYYPYSTVVPHIKVWNGCTVCDAIKCDCE